MSEHYVPPIEHSPGAALNEVAAYLRRAGYAGAYIAPNGGCIYYAHGKTVHHRYDALAEHANELRRQLDEAMEALKRIHRLAAPGNRVMDELTRDMMNIDDHARTARTFDPLAYYQQERDRLEKLFGKPPYDKLIELHVEPIYLPDARMSWIDAVADVTQRDYPCGPDPEVHGIRLVAVGDANRDYVIEALSERDRRAIEDAIEREAWRRIE